MDLLVCRRGVGSDPKPVIRGSGHKKAFLDLGMTTYRCFVRWFDDLRRLEVVSNEGQYPLLGVGLLLDRELRIDYRSSVITLE